ncbi:hypothetical protein BDW74DRAFT_142371 [Aspergillus multicolor]|uniref:uncharacterized protein n=1 Tax=Aspergillus multicolor TaxID=41759 RepID=UPI003CCE4381
MNNEQFRRLLFDPNKPSNPKSANASASPTGPSQTGKHGASSSSPQGAHGSGGQTPSAAQAMLGSRMRSSIPMTPRTLTAPNFATQLADYRRERDGGNPPPTKKFKSSAAPKGTKLPAGYEDRAAARLREDESAENKDAENEAKLKLLEEKFKKGVIDENTFMRLRRELGVGGDLGSTHMVKGLDWDLLRKVRAGEDVERVNEERKGEEGGGGQGEGEGEVEEEVDVDEEFDKVLEGKEGEVLPSAPKEKEKKKKGNMAPPPAAQKQRKTRDEILRELRASRAAASASAAAPAPAPVPESVLGTRFKKIGDSKPEKKRFIEQDENGRRREVLLITDADGNTKRKTRWLDKPGTTAPIAVPASTTASAPEKEKEVKPKPLGMEVPADIAARIAAQKNVENDEDDDIFAGVGADYDPLGDAGSDEDSSDSEEEEGEVATKPKPEQEAKKKTTGEPTTSTATAKPRNYFATSTNGKDEKQVESDRDRTNPLTKDPTILAALKRAAALRQAGEGSDEIADDEEGVDKETLLRRKRFLEEAKRREALDAMDLDYGFGGSRNEDDEDEDAVVLEMEPRGGNKRKRGPKKRKGDKDSAADVLGVLEGRKKSQN